MPFPVPFVPLVGVPTEIRQDIARPVAVVMTALHAVRLRADESFKHKLMHARIALAETYPQVAVVVRELLKHHAASRAAVAERPRDRPDPAAVGHLVSAGALHVPPPFTSHPARSRSATARQRQPPAGAAGGGSRRTARRAPPGRAAARRPSAPAGPAGQPRPASPAAAGTSR